MPKLLEKIRELLAGAITTENTEVMANISKALDEAEQSVTNLETENTTLKNKIVEMVKTTITSKEAPKDENTPDTPKTLDEALDGAIQKVVSERKK